MQSRTGFILLVLLAASCKPVANIVSAQASEPAPAQVVETRTPEIGNSFRKDMSYAELRKQLLAAGWLPLRDPKCWDNIGGEAGACNQLPEIETCNAEGLCMTRFANSSERTQIEIGASGQVRRWNVPGEEKAFQVKSWKFSNFGTAPKQSAACPSRNFDMFLKIFASDENIERAFIAPLIKVAELQTDDDEGFYVEKEGYNPRPVYVTAADYRDFNVVYKNGAFHFVNSTGKVESSQLQLSVTQEGRQKRFVSYQLNMSEGNSYRFEDKGDCWYLTEDPEPPTP